MSELMIRWYQFGCFSPIFRTHGCRATPDPDTTVSPCEPVQKSCGPNEVWSYGSDTQEILEKYIRLRAKMKPYIQELSINVTNNGVPTARPLWWGFPDDAQCCAINDQYLLGPNLLVAPVTEEGATSREVYFPQGVKWIHVLDGSEVLGGQKKKIHAPLSTIPAYRKEGTLEYLLE